MQRLIFDGCDATSCRKAAEPVSNCEGRAVPEEAPVAFVYNGSTHAVLLASPSDLADFATGFSLTEGIINSPSEIDDLEIVPSSIGIELRIWLNSQRYANLHRRRRILAGPTGCGLCGIESLAEAERPVRRVVTRCALTPDSIGEAILGLSQRQVLGKSTSGLHAAALFLPSEGIVCVKEDVGRHNAVDKLAGAIAVNEVDSSGAAIVITSRVSVEIVQKVGMIGASTVLSMSVPTSLAIRTAKAAGMTLISVARDNAPIVYT